nr:hypothetical protein [Tanacetum cinerariifolium]
DEFIHTKLTIHEEEETKDEERFDPIVQTPENSDDEDNDDASLGLNISSEEGQDAEDDEDELYRDVNIILEGRDFAGAVSSILGIVQRYMDQRMNEAVKMKNPLLDQTEGPKGEEKERNQSQQALQRRKQPGLLASLYKGLNLNKILQASLHRQRSQCKQLKIWKSPYIKSLKHVLLMINLLQKLLSILNGFSNKRNLQLLIVLGGSSKSLIELEFFLKEVYKANADQLDWNNPKGQQYPHNLLKPLPLIPNSLGRRVIPFDHFINNDLEYLRGGASNHKYRTFLTKTKATHYGHIKWIEDLVPRIMWSQELIIEWHNYKQLDWITVRKDDDKLYKFKEGDFK